MDPTRKTTRTLREDDGRKPAWRESRRPGRPHRDRLQSLVHQLTLAEEQERERLATLLHDDLQQILVGARIRLNVLENRARAGRAVGSDVGDLRTLLDDAIARTRNLSHDLHAAPLHRLGLTGSMRWLAEQMGARYDLDVDVSGDPGLTLSSEDLRTFVFRSVQELLFNVVKHSGAPSASIRLDRDAERVTVIVADDGCGFVPARPDAGRRIANGLGLERIRDRLRNLGGELRLDSAPGHGCRCILRLPLEIASACGLA